MGKIEKEPVSSIVEVMVHGVPLLERIKKKEVDKIKNFEIVGFLLKTAQEEVHTSMIRRVSTQYAKCEYVNVFIIYNF